MQEIQDIIKHQKEFFQKGTTKNVDFRIQQLKKFKQAIVDHDEEIVKALKDDLNKSEFETYATEVGILLDEINGMIKGLKKWSKPIKVRTPMMHFKSTSYIYKEPYGVALIIAPWNYPFQLMLSPLIGAMAAGNCAVLKPSEYTPHTSKIIAKIIENNFDEAYIAVVEGGREASQVLLEQHFDTIFFTGSVPVGKIVMAAAAKNLTPVTLELGGKSPCIVTEDADIKLAARRIAWGKFINAGQTCVAPDYMVVHERVKGQLLHEMVKVIEAFYGKDPSQSDDYVRIVNERHFDRLTRLLQEEKIIVGGEHNKEDLYIAPTIMDGITWDDPVMADEIFGPILPVLNYKNLDDVIHMVNDHPKPLALYIFSNHDATQQKIINSIPYGGGCVNDTIVHLATPYLPFGGVGHSGMGSYHGKASFDAFTHEKSILKKSNLLDIPLRYPPYRDKAKWLRKVFK